MKYLFVSGTLYDHGGLAMIQGAMNGILTLDTDAEFASLHCTVHNQDGVCRQFIEPTQNEVAFKWADVILDVGGLFTSQPNKYIWKELREKYDKPYVYMAQSFKEVDPILLEGTKIVARGLNSERLIRKLGFDCKVAPDLSFLVDPKKWTGKQYKRAFSTHVIKQIDDMYLKCKNTDVQVVWKPKNHCTWEPELPIDQFSGTVEEKFGLIGSVEEVHSSRYHGACAAILSGRPLTIYGTQDPKYDLKYADLLDFEGLSSEELKKLAMISCEVVKEVG